MKQFRRWAILGVWLAGLVAVWWIAPTRARYVIQGAHFLQFSPDGKQVAVATMAEPNGGEWQGRFHDVSTGQPTESFAVQLNQFKMPSSPFTPTDPGVNLTPPANVPHFGSARSEPFNTIAAANRVVTHWIGEDSQMAASVHDARTGRLLWTIPLSKPVQTYGQWELHSYSVYACDLSPDGRRLLMVTRPSSSSSIRKPPPADAPLPEVHEGVSVFDVNTGNPLARFPDAIGGVFMADSSAVIALQRTSKCDALVHLDATTGERQTIKEYRHRLVDLDKSAATFISDWTLMPSRLDDGRIIAARLNVGAKPSYWSQMLSNGLNRIVGREGPARLDTRLIDASTGREFGGGLFAVLGTAHIDSSGTVIAMSYDERDEKGGQRWHIEVWDVPPRRSWNWIFAGMAFWTSALAMVFGVVKLLRWLFK